MVSLVSQTNTLKAFTENYKTWLKGLKEDLNKWKAL